MYVIDKNIWNCNIKLNFHKVRFFFFYFCFFYKNKTQTQSDSGQIEKKPCNIDYKLVSNDKTNLKKKYSLNQKDFHSKKFSGIPCMTIWKRQTTQTVTYPATGHITLKNNKGKKPKKNRASPKDDMHSNKKKILKKTNNY